MNNLTLKKIAVLLPLALIVFGCAQAPPSYTPSDLSPAPAADLNPTPPPSEWTKTQYEGLTWKVVNVPTDPDHPELPQWWRKIIFRNDSKDILTFNYIVRREMNDTPVATGWEASGHQDNNFFVNKLYPGSESSGRSIGYGMDFFSYSIDHKYTPSPDYGPIWVSYSAVIATPLEGDLLKSLNN